MRGGWTSLLIFATAFWLLDASGALAEAATENACKNYVGVSNRIVMCVRGTLDSVTGVYYADFYSLVRRAIGGFLTLGIIVYGIMAAFGMLEKISRDTFMLVIKLAMISYFIVNTDEMYDTTLKVMDATAGIIVASTPGDGEIDTGSGSARVTCLNNMLEAAADNGTRVNAPWLGLDCIVDSVIGIKLPSGTGTTPAIGAEAAAEKAFNANLAGRGMSRGLLNFFFASMGTSIIGIILAVIGFIFIYSLMFLILKALFTYLMGYLGVAFMMIFAPIFIPLSLFRTTSEYFRKWVKLTISFALQPVLILIFITFSITAVDLAMFSGEYSVMYRLAGDASRAKNFNINTYLTDRKIVKPMAVRLVDIRTGRLSVENFRQEQQSINPGSIYIDCSQAVVSKNEEARRKCSESYAIRMWRDQVDWEQLAKQRMPEVIDPNDDQPNQPTTADARKARQLMREVIASTIFALLVVLIMNGLLSIVPAIANGLVGEELQTPNLVSSISRAGGFGSTINSLLSGGRR